MTGTANNVVKQLWIMRPSKWSGDTAIEFDTPGGKITKFRSKSKAAGLGGERWKAEYGGTEYSAKTPDAVSIWLKDKVTP